ncbi:uncharacterized protein LOC8287554 [Ricinus communis]|uniref:uncharacterized protein LOC8287554 n=1 Tax=Ricinus communis TaxID=3988 RepID=UPI00201ADE1E|nr:uncharacterized protein LOC8287554 [Ricinus communis]
MSLLHRGLQVDNGISGPVGVVRRVDSSHSWCPPLAGLYTLNCDASVKDDKAAVGVVLSNERGEVMFCVGKQIGGCLEVELAEGQAVLFGLWCAIDCGFSSIVIESDCSTLIQKLTSIVHGSSPMQLLVDDINHLSESFPFVSFEHINRKVNLVAHSLAKWASSWKMLLFC